MMKKLTTFLAIAAVLLIASNAFAGFTNVRPDLSLTNLGALQTFFNDSAGGAINAYTDQEPWAIWQSTTSLNSTFTLRLEMAAYAAQNKFGIYNYGSPGGPKYEIFDGAAGVRYYSTATFNAGGVVGKLVVNHFDDAAAFLGSTTYFGVNHKAFGFYLDSPDLGGRTFYSEDNLNPGGYAHNLVYAGQAEDAGNWWLAWEDLDRVDGADEDFTDMIVFAESINPAVPEPGTLALLGFGLAGSALAYRRRRNS